MNELWKDIEGYEGLYQVSTTGKVRSLDRIRTSGKPLKGKVLKHGIEGGGYAFVSLQKDSVKRNAKIHRLVAKAFLPEIQRKEQVNHIDGVKLNNDVSNLEWCTPAENHQHKQDTGLQQKNGNQVNVIVMDNITGKIVYSSSLRKLGLFFGLSEGWGQYRRKVYGDSFNFKNYTVEVIQ